MRNLFRKCVAVLAMLGVVGLNMVPIAALAQDKPAAEVKMDAKPAPAKEEKKEEAKPAPTPNKGDVAWMLTCAALVLMLSVPALALF